MKILVAVKRVVDAKIKVRPLPDHSGVDVKLAKMAMNPFDEIAIEKAVTLREAGVADEVVAVTVGPLKAVDTLRVAMAIGADRAVHVRTDESLEPLAVAKVLHAVVEREKPDLVLLGKQAIDDDANQTGQMLSALCDMPLATFANEIVLEGGRWVVTRETDGGTQTVSLATPAVVTAASCRAALRDAARRGRRPAACGGLAQDACCKLCSLDGRGKASALRRRGGGHALACLSRSA